MGYVITEAQNSAETQRKNIFLDREITVGYEL